MVTSRTRDWAKTMEFLFWAWGQDLQHKKRKTFLAYGFKRNPPPKQIGGKSMYMFHDSEIGFVCLWAFGIMAESRDGRCYFFKRGRIRPWVLSPFQSPPFDYVSLEQLKSRQVRANYTYQVDLIREALSSILPFIVRYEAWIESQFGSEYRTRYLIQYQKKILIQRHQNYTSLALCLSEIREWVESKNLLQSIESFNSSSRSEHNLFISS
jgi:hypothetical protein